MRIPTIAICAALLLAGCEKETTLHAGLAERQANLVMAALIDAGIGCHKSPGEEGTWDVTVVESRFADAVNQALAFGSPLSEALEQQAQTIREEQRAELEAEIERVPVKMLIPLGTLIVPAMLLSILGPLLGASLAIA